MTVRRDDQGRFLGHDPMFDWTTDTSIREAVFQALGAASTCWEHPEGAGAFDRERVGRIGDELMAFLRQKLSGVGT
jgi:hypothetical protein